MYNVSQLGYFWKYKQLMSLYIDFHFKKFMKTIAGFVSITYFHTNNKYLQMCHMIMPTRVCFSLDGTVLVLSWNTILTYSGMILEYKYYDLDFLDKFQNQISKS